MYENYFKCNKANKQYWFDLYLKTYFKEQKLKQGINERYNK